MSQLDPRSIPRIGARRLARGEGRYVDDIEPPMRFTPPSSAVPSPTRLCAQFTWTRSAGPAGSSPFTRRRARFARGSAVARWMDRAGPAPGRRPAARRRPRALRRRGGCGRRREGPLRRRGRMRAGGARSRAAEVVADLDVALDGARAGAPPTGATTCSRASSRRGRRRRCVRCCRRHRRRSLRDRPPDRVADGMSRCTGTPGLGDRRARADQLRAVPAPLRRVPRGGARTRPAARCASSRPTSAAASASRTTRAWRRPSSRSQPCSSAGRSAGCRTARAPPGRRPRPRAALRRRAGRRRDGRMLAVRGRLLYDAGAWTGNHGAGTAVYSSLMLPGPYALEHYRLDILALATNPPPSAAYRGYGAPEAAFAMEGLVDALARGSGLDPVEVRRRNLIPATAYPYRTATGSCTTRPIPPGARSRPRARRRRPPPRPGSASWRAASQCSCSWVGSARPGPPSTPGCVRRLRDRPGLIDRDGHVTVAIGMPTAGPGRRDRARADCGGRARRRSRASRAHGQLGHRERAPYSPVGRDRQPRRRRRRRRGRRRGRAPRRSAATDGRGCCWSCAPDDVVLRDGHAARGDGALPLGAVAAAIHRGHLRARSRTRPRSRAPRPSTPRRRRSPTAPTSRSRCGRGHGRGPARPLRRGQRLRAAR